MSTHEESARRHAYYIAHRDHWATWGRKRYLARRDEILARQRERIAVDPAARRATQARYRAKNKAKIDAHRATHPMSSEYRSAWNAAHPHWRETARYRAVRVTSEARRRTFALGNGGSHTTQEWLDKCALLGNVCIYCGEAKPLTRDHKIPLSRGGSNDIANIVPACLSCNSKKRARTATEYIALRRAA